MPVTKASNGKYRIGHGKAMYHSKAKADRAYKAYLAIKNSESKSEALLSLCEDNNPLTTNSRVDWIKKLYARRPDSFVKLPPESRAYFIPGDNDLLLAGTTREQWELDVKKFITGV